MATSSSHK